ncbi:hypothetical protein ACH492_23915 [Streptomyces sp. NPDC019443]|uniref:hypothetical protein n=1 Tax=Streptomyces sp. NPDC019443 TaxID=3365061 RepID=UPI0037BD86B4
MRLRAELVEDLVGYLRPFGRAERPVGVGEVVEEVAAEPLGRRAGLLLHRVGRPLVHLPPPALPLYPGQRLRRASSPVRPR